MARRRRRRPTKVGMALRAVPKRLPWHRTRVVNGTFFPDKIWDGSESHPYLKGDDRPLRGLPGTAVFVVDVRFQGSEAVCKLA